MTISRARKSGKGASSIDNLPHADMRGGHSASRAAVGQHNPPARGGFDRIILRRFERLTRLDGLYAAVEPLLGFRQRDVRTRKAALHGAKLRLCERKRGLALAFGGQRAVTARLRPRQ
jgi:hypothetical protein